jgi:hypothetical protein
MQTIKTITAAAVMTAAFLDITDAQDSYRVTLYEHENYGGSAITFLAPWPSTCYNIWDCFNDRATSAKWTDFGVYFEPDMLTFYDDADCKGSKLVVQAGQYYPANGIPNVGAAMNDRISSFSTFTGLTGITGYAGYKCSARRVGNETVAPVQIPMPASGL